MECVGIGAANIVDTNVATSSFDFACRGEEPLDYSTSLCFLNNSRNRGFGSIRCQSL